MDKSARQIDVLIYNGINLLDVSGPVQAFTEGSATTHWAREADVRRRFPNVHWNLNRIMASTNNVYTSAGFTTGIDLALRIIRQDCGTQAALAVAREQPAREWTLAPPLPRYRASAQFEQTALELAHLRYRQLIERKLSQGITQYAPGIIE